MKTELGSLQVDFVQEDNGAFGMFTPLVHGALKDHVNLFKFLTSGWFAYELQIQIVPMRVLHPHFHAS